MCVRVCARVRLYGVSKSFVKFIRITTYHYQYTHTHTHIGAAPLPRMRRETLDFNKFDSVGTLLEDD